MRGLVKAFDRKVAVDRLSLDIPVSSFYGIVGPNGAGKTTSLSMATGLLRPDAGQVLVHGVDVWTQPQRAKTLLGVLPDGLRTFDRLNGLELVTYSGLLRGLERDVVVPRATELVKVLGLWDAGTTLVADYSAGMRKKIHLACAMVHSPSILGPDEPFPGLEGHDGVMVIQYDHTAEHYLEHLGVRHERMERSMPVPFRYAEHTH